MNWIKVEDQLPKIKQTVLCCYKVGNNRYFVIAHIYQIVNIRVTEAETTTSVDWIDERGNTFDPTHWAPIEPPVEDAKG